MNRRTFLAASAGLLATPAMGQSKAKERIRIVSSLPRTGSAQGQTDTIVNGITMAIEEFEGKIAGFEIKYSDRDDATAAQGQWDATAEADIARQAAKNDEVMAFIGPYNSGAAMVSMPILNEAGIVQVTPSATWPGLTKKVKGDGKRGEPGIYRPSKKITFCRVCPTDFIQGPLTAAFVAKELKAKSVYILDDKELYGAGIAAAFEEKCKELKITVLGHESIKPDARDYSTVVAKIKKAAPDALYFGGTSQSGGPQLARDLKAAEVSFPLVVPDGCYERAFIEAAGQDAVNHRVYVTIGGIEPSELKGAGAEFVKRYKKKFNADPVAYAVYGYEAAAVILEAIRKVGKRDREAIRKAVVETKDFDKGVLGKWSFDADGDTTLQQLTVSKIENGKFMPIKVLSSDDK